jgi:uncharacterized BrkB/YihY/UPF0761 family membrane protein
VFNVFSQGGELGWVYNLMRFHYCLVCLSFFDSNSITTATLTSLSYIASSCQFIHLYSIMPNISLFQLSSFSIPAAVVADSILLVDQTAITCQLQYPTLDS